MIVTRPSAPLMHSSTVHKSTPKVTNCQSRNKQSEQFANGILNGNSGKERNIYCAVLVGGSPPAGTCTLK